MAFPCRKGGSAGNFLGHPTPPSPRIADELPVPAPHGGERAPNAPGRACARTTLAEPHRLPLRSEIPSAVRTGEFWEASRPINTGTRYRPMEETSGSPAVAGGPLVATIHG